MNRRSSIYLAAGFLAALPAHAANLSLSQAISEANVNSPVVEKSVSAKEEAKWKRVEAFSTYLPTLSANANWLAAKKYVFTDIVFGGNPASIPGIVPTTTFGLSAQWSVFEGMAGTLRYQAASQVESAAEKELDWSRFETSRAVALQFYRAIASRTLKEVADQNVRNLKDHLKDVSAFKKSGLSTNYDVLQVEVQVTEAEAEAMNAQDNIAINDGRLAQILGTQDARTPEGALPVLSPDLIKNLENASFEQRKDIQALAERSEALEKATTAAGNFWIPRASLFATYTNYNNLSDAILSRSDFRNAYQVGVSLNWNIFDGLVSYSRARQSSEQKVQVETNLHSSRLAAKQDIDVYKRKYLYHCAVYRSRLTNIDRAKEAVRLAREGRKAGVRTSTDLLDAEAALYRAQAGAVDAQLGSIESLVNLERASGVELLPL
jgi:outer membrane protein TolC